jgi:hypothetical protein
VTVEDTFRPALGSMIGGAGLYMDKEGLPIVAPGGIWSVRSGANQRFPKNCRFVRPQRYASQTARFYPYLLVYIG